MSMTFVEASTQTVAMGSGSSALAGAMSATLCVWIYANTFAAGNHSVYGMSNGVAAGSSRAKIGVSPTGQIRGNGRCLDADANQDFLGTAGIIVTGRWYHIAATFDYPNDRIRLYYNGVLDTTSGVLAWGAPPVSATNSLSMNIGSQHSGGSEYFNGIIEDARCYNRLLSVDELSSIYYARGKDSIAHGLQHRYLLNESHLGAVASGTAVIKDIGPLGLHGTPANSPTWSESYLVLRRRLI